MVVNRVHPAARPLCDHQRQLPRRVLCAGQGADRAWQLAYRRAVSTATIVMAADEVQRRAHHLRRAGALAELAVH